MQHLEEQHKLSMERLREELESDKFQAVEDARVIITKHHEYIEGNLKEQLNEYINKSKEYREEIDLLRESLSRKDESLKSLKEDLEKIQESKPSSYDQCINSIPTYQPSTHSGLSSSQFSLSSSSDSQGSRTSQDHFYYPENTGIVESLDDSQRGSGSGLLGKVFGSGWFSPSKNREQSRRGSTPCKYKKNEVIEPH
ncbi:hypothetical protein Avbf_17234 [Armadillidium vulgare]|nr:hypothetical protein Avbf_17234 [Armadillidium vulgare]